jgi:hypothetical protein
MNGVARLGNPLAGAYLRGNGSYSFRDCEFSDSLGVALTEGVDVHGDGVVALEGVTRWDGAAGLRVDKCRFSGNAGVDLLFDDSTGSLRSEGVGFGNPHVRQQGCVPVPPPALETAGHGAFRVDRCPQVEDFVIRLHH